MCLFFAHKSPKKKSQSQITQKLTTSLWSSSATQKSNELSQKLGISRRVVHNLLVLNVANEGMIHFIISKNHPSNPQQPIHSLRLAPVRKMFVQWWLSWLRFISPFWWQLRDSPSKVCPFHCWRGQGGTLAAPQKILQCVFGGFHL